MEESLLGCGGRWNACRRRWFQTAGLLLCADGFRIAPFSELLVLSWLDWPEWFLSPSVHGRRCGELSSESFLAQKRNCREIAPAAAKQVQKLRRPKVEAWVREPKDLYQHVDALCQSHLQFYDAPVTSGKPLNNDEFL